MTFSQLANAYLPVKRKQDYWATLQYLANSKLKYQAIWWELQHHFFKGQVDWASSSGELKAMQAKVSTEAASA